jgi:TonB family protein
MKIAFVRSKNRLFDTRSPVGSPGRSRAIARPAFYNPPPRWHFFAAFAGALTLELAAVAVAGLHEAEKIPVETGIFPKEHAAEVILTQLPPEPTPPPENQPPPIPLPPIEPDAFIINEPTPPRHPASLTKPKTAVAALKVADTISRPATFLSGAANLISAPHPAYPYEARRFRLTGSGKFLLKFDSDGNVTDVIAAQSTGSKILDRSSISTLLRWRCQPGAYTQVYVPVTFTLAGAQL